MNLKSISKKLFYDSDYLDSKIPDDCKFYEIQIEIILFY